MLSLTAGMVSGFGVAPAPVHAFAVAPARVSAPAVMASRWPDPILNEDLPDPVFDEKSPYTGSAPYGFSNFAEKMNGRAAMMGFVILFMQELITGKGVLELYGLPYDAGAVLLK
jgi:hypothetical protein